MKSFGQPPRFTDEELEVQVGKSAAQASRITPQGVEGAGSQHPVLWVSPAPFLAPQGPDACCRLFLVFSPTVLSLSHQGMSAQSHSLLSMGKLSPYKPRIPSKTRCSSAVTQATKC